MQPPVSLLFVCTGNICRSPTAEGVMQQAVTHHKLPVTVDSAGTSAYHIGEAPDRRTQTMALRYGLDLSSQRARQVQPEDFARFDLILAMDHSHLASLERMRPKAAHAELALYLPYAGITSPSDMPDPYYGSEADFREVYTLCANATARLLAQWYGLQH